MQSRSWCAIAPRHLARAFSHPLLLLRGAHKQYLRLAGTTAALAELEASKCFVN